jgi:agmatine/peptidylarginine deiminase
MQIIDYGYHLSIEANRDPEFEADLKRISKNAKWDRDFGTYVIDKNYKQKAINLAKSYFDLVEVM